MFFRRFAIAMLLMLALTTGALAAPLEFDVIIVGAGTGGCSAAIQAARMGTRVALIEETGWVGGQLTAAGVTTFDDQRLNRSGFYREYIDRLNALYHKMGVNNSICYWGADVISGSADVERDLFETMLKEAGVRLFLHTSILSVHEKNGAVTGASFSRGSERFDITSKVLIDATECGDVLPLTSARYRVGNSLSPKIDLDASIQDITWVAAIHKVKGTVPDELRMTRKSAEYDSIHKRFTDVFVKNGNSWPHGYPYSIPTFNAYRAIPDPDWNLPIIGDKATTWSNVTATSLNWGNDYPGNVHEMPGLTVRYLEDKNYRRQVNAKALIRTLDLLYYYQTELGQSDWAVDTRIGYEKSGDDPKNVAASIPQGYQAVARSMPPIPYVRESRRIVGMKTLTAATIRRDSETGEALNHFAESIAIGEYPVDVHGCRIGKYLEADLGDQESDFPGNWKPGRFQVPLACLIPEKLDGFLAAEKNISVSRMVNGSIRLHPITMLTGQAAGALAALSVQLKTPPRAVPVKAVQGTLLKAGSRLALIDFLDDKPKGRGWTGTQAAQLYSFLPPYWDKKPGQLPVYGAAFSISARDLTKALHAAFPNKTLKALPEDSEPVTYRDFERIMAQVSPSYDGWKTVLYSSQLLPTVKRGEAASVLWDIIVHEAKIAQK